MHKVFAQVMATVVAVFLAFAITADRTTAHAGKLGLYAAIIALWAFVTAAIWWSDEW